MIIIERAQQIGNNAPLNGFMCAINTVVKAVAKSKRNLIIRFMFFPLYFGCFCTTCVDAF